MAQDRREMLEFLNFELKFLEDGGVRSLSAISTACTECVRGLTEQTIPIPTSRIRAVSVG